MKKVIVVESILIVLLVFYIVFLMQKKRTYEVERHQNQVQIDGICEENNHLQLKLDSVKKIFKPFDYYNEITQNKYEKEMENFRLLPDSIRLYEWAKRTHSFRFD